MNISSSIITDSNDLRLSETPLDHEELKAAALYVARVSSNNGFQFGSLSVHKTASSSFTIGCCGDTRVIHKAAQASLLLTEITALTNALKDLDLTTEVKFSQELQPLFKNTTVTTPQRG